jgi:hypothetical protein
MQQGSKRAKRKQHKGQQTSSKKGKEKAEFQSM